MFDQINMPDGSGYWQNGIFQENPEWGGVSYGMSEYEARKRAGLPTDGVGQFSPWASARGLTQFEDYLGKGSPFTPGMRQYIQDTSPTVSDSDAWSNWVRSQQNRESSGDFLGINGIGSFDDWGPLPVALAFAGGMYNAGGFQTAPAASGGSAMMPPAIPEADPTFGGALSQVAPGVYSATPMSPLSQTLMPPAIPEADPTFDGVLKQAGPGLWEASKTAASGLSVADLFKTGLNGLGLMNALTGSNQGMGGGMLGGGMPALQQAPANIFTPVAPGALYPFGR